MLFDVLSEIFRYGRWMLVALIVILILWRARRIIQPLRFMREAAIVVFAYFAYFIVRGFTEGGQARALDNARRLIDIEDSLGILWEPSWQRVIIDYHWMVTLANWVYIWGHWPLIGIVAVWLYLYRARTYYIFRNAFLISGAIGLVIFALFPVAPPRFTDMDVVDTVTSYSKAYRVLQPPALVNQYAAVPSLHFGWNLLVGIALVRESRALIPRLFGVFMPVIMFLAVVLTANHYILDAVAGAAVALFGLAVAWTFRDGVNIPPLQAARRALTRWREPRRRLQQAHRT